LLSASYKGKRQQKGGNVSECAHLPIPTGPVTAAPRPPLSSPRSPTHAPTVVTLTIVGTQFTLRPAPEREPPFDDERDPLAPDPPGPLQPTLPFPPMHPPVRHRPAILPRSPRRAAAGDPAGVARRLLLGIVEVAGRRRPLGQLSTMLSPAVAVGLRGDLTPTRTSPHRLRDATVTSVRSSEPADGIAELSATLRTPQRVHAAALRLEIRRGQWVCTRLIIG